MIDYKEVRWTPETDIIEPYLNLEPQYEIICEDKFNLKVLKVKLKDNVEFVLKQLRIKSKKESKIRDLFREYRIGNILGELTDGVAMSKDIKKKEVGEDTVIEILMEYGGIPLSTFVREKKLEEGGTMNIACQLLSILTLMEELGISHLDIKPRNIVWDENKNRVKLIDFGTSLMSFGKDNTVSKEVDCKKILGYTKQYSAPEIKEEAQRVIPQKLDVYSFGVTFLRLLAAEYKIQNPIEYNENSFIKKFNIEELKEKTEQEDMDGLWEVIHKTIEKDPQFRPTFRELREAFLKQAKEMTEDDYLLDVIGTLNDHPIKIELTNNLELKNMYKRLMYLYLKMENYDMAIKCIEKYLEICSELELENSLDVAYLYCILAGPYNIINKEEEVTSYLDKALNILLKIPREDNRLLKMLYKIIRLFYAYSGDSKKAKEQYDKAFKIESEEYDIEANLYHSIAETWISINNYEKLGEAYHKALEEIGKKESVQGISTARLYIILGLAYFFKGNYGAAKRVLNKALDKMLSEYEGQELFIIITYSLLGSSDSYIGNFDQAIKAFDEGLSVSLAINGGMNMYTLYLYEAKVCAYLFKGDYKRSIELCNKSLKPLLCKLELQHHRTLPVYLYLGMSYFYIGDFMEAKSNYLKALDIVIKVFKGDDIVHASIYNNLGILFLFYENNVDKGVDYCNRALTILLKIYDKDHPYLLGIYHNLMCGHFFKSDFQKVIELCNIGLEILLRIGAKESQAFAIFSLYLDTSYLITGNKGLNISYINKSLKTLLSICGEQDMLAIKIHNLLEYICQTKGDYVLDLEKVKEFSNIYESIVKKRNTHTVSYYIVSGAIYNSKKDYSNAKAAYKQGLEISLNVYGELNYMTAECLAGLGLVYVELRNIKKAEKCLNKALSILMKISAESDCFTGAIYLYLALIYKMTGRYEEALCALDKALNILYLHPITHKDLVPFLNDEIKKLCEIIERGD